MLFCSVEEWKAIERFGMEGFGDLAASGVPIAITPAGFFSPLDALKINRLFGGVGAQWCEMERVSTKDEERCQEGEESKEVQEGPNFL